MRISRKVIGERLIILRNELGMEQTYVADKTSTLQSTISHLEKGDGGGLDALIKVLEFYGSYFNLTHFFSDEFSPMQIAKYNSRQTIFKTRLLQQIGVTEDILKKEFDTLKRMASDAVNQLPSDISSKIGKGSI